MRFDEKNRGKYLFGNIRESGTKCEKAKNCEEFSNR